MTFTSRFRRAARRARLILTELDDAQRRLFEARTGVPIERRSPHH